MERVKWREWSGESKGERVKGESKVEIVKWRE